MIVSGVFALPFDDPAGFTAPPAFGPFRVLHQIGSGVLGPVFRTFDPLSEKLVAVKVFRLDVVPEVSARLADALMRLAETPVEHPAVVAVLDAGMEGTTAFLAMEYVAAETLDVTLRRMVPASLETAGPMLRQVADALEAAWSVGIGHGALHPRDIFLPNASEASQGGVGVRVAGFGVTEALESLGIRTPMRRPYTAPEREQGHAWDIRADVYSLGVIAHELLMGRRPADLAAPAEPDGQGAAIRRALSRALALDPAQRFETPTAFVDALVTGAVPGVAAEEPAASSSVEADTAVQDAADSGAPEVPARPVAPPPDVRAAAPDEPRPALVAARARDWSPAVPQREPRETAMPRVMSLAAMLLVGLAAGTAFGYWWRGPVPAPGAPMTVADATPPPLAETKVPDDEPIGTEVSVKEPAKPSPTATPVATPAAHAAPEASGRRARNAGPMKGTVLVETRPAGATVSIDGRVVGKAPMRTSELSPGSHTVKLLLAGHKSVTTTVVVRAGQQTPVRVSLEIR